MSPSESIQKQLDERGIDYQMHDGGNRVCFYFDYSEQCGDFLKSIDVIGACVIASQSYLTPEQAIAATVGGYGITFAPTLDRPPETMVGETVYDSEGNAVGWITSATVGVGTCQRERFDADPDGIFVGETVIDDEGNEMPIAEIFGYRCSECKGLLELEWVACPHCGKRIIEEEK